jgi:purine-cytosine permease-like protein
MLHLIGGVIFALIVILMLFIIFLIGFFIFDFDLFKQIINNFRSRPIILILVLLGLFVFWILFNLFT